MTATLPTLRTVVRAEKCAPGGRTGETAEIGYPHEQAGRQIYSSTEWSRIPEEIGLPSGMGDKKLWLSG